MSRSTPKPKGKLSKALSRALPDADKERLEGLIESYKNKMSTQPLKLKEPRLHPQFRHNAVSVSAGLDSIKQFQSSHYDDLSSSTLFLSASNIKKLKTFDKAYTTTAIMEKPIFSGDEILLTSEEAYGTKIKDVRKARKLSQTKLALLAGISVLSIKKIENGLGNPSLKTVLKINAVLNLKLAVI